MCWQTVEQQSNPALAIASSVGNKAESKLATKMIENMKKLLFIALFLLFTLYSNGQETKFPQTELIMDLDSLVSFIEQVHPNPYANISKNEIYRDIKRAKKSMPDSVSLIKFFTIISPVVSKLKDGHTGVLFPYREWKSMNPFCFPFNPQISFEGKLFASDRQSSLPKGAEILSINDIPSIHIFTMLLSSINGESEKWRISLLNQSFVERFGVFYGFDSIYKIKYKLEDKTDTLTIQGYRLKDLLELKRKEQKKKETQNIVQIRPYSFKILADKTGLIDFKEFSGEAQFPGFLDSIFSVMSKEKTKNLIIDLRDNGGGNSILGDELFQYISKVPFSQAGKTITKYSNIQSQFYEKHRKSGNFSFLTDLSESEFNTLVSHKPGSIVILEDTLIPLRENKYRFSGNVYVLASINSFSSASMFAWCFHKFNMGVIVGEETGGYIVSFGDIIYSVLPKSNLNMTISTKELYLYGTTDNDRHGVLPDYQVKPDDALDFTLKLINKE